MHTALQFPHLCVNISEILNVQGKYYFKMVLVGVFPFSISVMFLQSLRFTDAGISTRLALLRVHLSWYPSLCPSLWCLTSHLAAIETVRTWLHSIPYGDHRWGLSSSCCCADVFSKFWEVEERKKPRKSELFSRTFFQLSMRRQWIPNE